VENLKGTEAIDDEKVPTVCEFIDAMNQMMEEMQAVGSDAVKAKEA
jgi:hypothetical protein